MKFHGYKKLELQTGLPGPEALLISFPNWLSSKKSEYYHWYLVSLFIKKPSQGKNAQRWSGDVEYQRIRFEKRLKRNWGDIVSGRLFAYALNYQKQSY